MQLTQQGRGQRDGVVLFDVLQGSVGVQALKQRAVLGCGLQQGHRCGAPHWARARASPRVSSSTQDTFSIACCP